ncbi:NDR1/HIN1-like protein 10 [Apium graveolens]|uniref:NDR1/HIN1-like protein 10 n=1 Tax=Apium graveolens TaxID=4045 RepID=UPI003D79BBA6
MLPPPSPPPPPLLLPPPPTPPPFPLTPPPPPHKLRVPPRNQLVSSEKGRNHKNVPAELLGSARKTRIQPLLRPPRRTNPLIWFCAILCLVFSLALIVSGILTLIVFLDIKPRKPLLDTPNASLSVIYFDSPENLNSDFTFLANFSNPNKKLDVRIEYLEIELYFSDSLLASQVLPPFSQKPREAKLITVRFISSLVYLPPKVALELQKQVVGNKVVYNIRGTFKVRISFGLIHFHYWLHRRCQLELTSPPTGILITRSCKTKR